MGAPTTKIETFVVTSPLKVLSFTCLFFATLSLVITVPSTFWLYGRSDNERYGLWVKCVVEEDPNLKLNSLTSSSASPFVNEDLLALKVACSLVNKVWIQLTAGLIALSLACAIISVVCITMGLNHNKRQERKVRLYNASLFSLVSGFVSITVGLVLFPFMFLKEFDQETRENWYFGWSYGVGVGAAIFYAGAIILLAFDRKREEVFYRERLYINQDDEEENFEVNQESKIKASRP